MSLNTRKNLDYNQKYQIDSSRTIFANYVQRKFQVNDGTKVGINIAPPDNEASIVTFIKEGEVNTTPEELDFYLSQVDGRSLVPKSPPVPVFIPLKPVITSITGRNQYLLVNFTQEQNSATILNYNYSTDGGLTFRSLSPASTNSPLFITTLSTDGTTPLTNFDTYSILIQAVTINSVSNESNQMFGMPEPTPVLQTFTTVGSTTWTAPFGVTSVDYLIVGGGGGSGGGYDGGGGGGGGGGMVLIGTTSVVPEQIYTIVVGDGGAAGISIRSPVSETNGGSGGNSSFGTVVALGGGGGYASRLRRPDDTTAGLGGSAASGTLVASIGGNGGGNRFTVSRGAGGGGGGSVGNGTNGEPLTSTTGRGGLGGQGYLDFLGTTYGQGGPGANGNVNWLPLIYPANTGSGAGGGGAASFSQQNGAKGSSGFLRLSYEI